MSYRHPFASSQANPLVHPQESSTLLPVPAFVVETVYAGITGEVHAAVAGVAEGKGLEVGTTFLRGPQGSGRSPNRRAGPCLREGQSP